MAISTIHKLDKIILPTNVEFSTLMNAQWSAEIQSLLEYPAGHVHPMFTAVQTQRPVVSFTTPRLDTLLGAIGVGGAALGSVATYFKLATATGNAARNASSHQKVTIASSLGYWTGLKLPHNAVGSADVMIAAVYDGTNNPFVYAGSQALSGNLTAAGYFGAGPVAINGVAIPGIQDISVESGITLQNEGGESELWDTFIGIEKTAPVVTITTKTLTNWSTLGLAGTALNGSSGLQFYARKFSPNGNRVANATAEHIYFQGLLGMALPVNTSGEGNKTISDTLRVVLISGSDSVVPLIGTTASAIT